MRTQVDKAIAKHLKYYHVSILILRLGLCWWLFQALYCISSCKEQSLLSSCKFWDQAEKNWGLQLKIVPRTKNLPQLQPLTIQWWWRMLRVNAVDISFASDDVNVTAWTSQDQFTLWGHSGTDGPPSSCTVFLTLGKFQIWVRFDSVETCTNLHASSCMMAREN